MNNECLRVQSVAFFAFKCKIKCKMREGEKGKREARGRALR